MSQHNDIRLSSAQEPTISRKNVISTRQYWTSEQRVAAILTVALGGARKTVLMHAARKSPDPANTFDRLLHRLIVDGLIEQSPPVMMPGPPWHKTSVYTTTSKGRKFLESVNKGAALKGGADS